MTQHHIVIPDLFTITPVFDQSCMEYGNICSREVGTRKRFLFSAILISGLHTISKICAIGLSPDCGFTRCAYLFCLLPENFRLKKRPHKLSYPRFAHYAEVASPGARPVIFKLPVYRTKHGVYAHDMQRDMPGTYTRIFVTFNTNKPVQ